MGQLRGRAGSTRYRSFPQSLTPGAYSSGTTLQPPDDLVGSRFARRDLLHHRNVRIGVFLGKGSAVGFKEQPHGEESGSLVAIRQRVVAGQMLDQDRRFLYERGICVLTAKACLRCGESRVRKGDPGQARDLLGRRAEQFSGDLAVIAKLQIDRQGLLGEAAQGLAIGLDRSLDPTFALGAASRQAKAQLVSLSLRSSWSLGLHRRHIVAPGPTALRNHDALNPRGPVVGQFYIQIIGNSRTQPGETAA